MFLLNLLHKYCAMNTSFKISLLYLLFIIPQHGNTPLPVKESWLQKDQDDGFIQQDMTSSLTGGDESFGSAHQTYKNSLIRTKKSDILGSQLPNSNYMSYPSKFDVNQQYEQPNLLYDAQYFKKEFSRPVDETGLNNMYEGYDGAGPSYNPYLLEPQHFRNPAEDPSFSRFMNSLGDSPTFFNTNMRVLNGRLNLRAEAERNLNLRSEAERNLNLRSEAERNLNPINEGIGRNTKWTMCKRLKARYAPNPLVELSQPLEDRNSRGFDESIPLQNDYLPLEDEQTGSEITDEEYKDVNRGESRNPQIFDENEYYDSETNPMIGEDEEGSDYSQMLNEHAYMHKRDEARQLENSQKTKASQATRAAVDTLKAPNFGRTYISDPSSNDNSAHVRNLISKTRDVETVNSDGTPDSDLVWKLTSDFQTKELNNVMRNSQRALQEVQQLQQKLSYKPQDVNENEGLKRQSRRESSIRSEKKSLNLDEKRLKREDEDEQKNMKTGTDEGGGGEYEDEEGKGHKDEEEYYEEADLSEDEFGNDIQKIDNLKQKYMKRATTEDKTQTNPKDVQNDNSSQDYELNLENAPIENAERSRKTSYGEGEKTKKSVRKGVKIWDQWGKWSPCSVTCGVGRSTRWRHCIGGGCAQGEKEAQIKRCTNPAC